MQIKKSILKLLNIDIDATNIEYERNALEKHLIKRNHFDVIKYLDKIENIIENPDYVGVNPNEKDYSIEYVKRYKNNVLVALKINVDRNGFYVSSMYSVKESKIKRRLYSGRLRPLDKN